MDCLKYEDPVFVPCQYFFDLEKEMDMFSMESDGIYFWQLVRHFLLKKIMIKDTIVVSNNKDRNLKGEIIGALRSCKVMRQRVKKMEHADIVRIRPCLTLSPDGRLDDHQYDHTDLGENVTAIDVYALGNYTDTPDVIRYSMAQAEFSLILWKIKRRLFGSQRIDSRHIGKISVFLDKIDGVYGTDLHIDKFVSQIQYAIACHKIYVAYFSRIFQIVRPKAIMIYPHYDEHMFAATAAAREMGIATIEIQHGRINAHEAYWYEEQSLVGKLLPDHFFTFGDWWNGQIKLPDFCQVVAVGNVYLEEQVQRFSRSRRDKLTIGVFSSPQNGKELCKFINKVNVTLKGKDVRVLYKLHPNECKVWKAEYPEILGVDNITVIDDGTSVYEIIAKSDIVFGINSTTFFEATIYDSVKIIIYMAGDYNAMKPLLDSGAATGITSMEEFIAVLEEDGSVNDPYPGEFRFWKRNARYNIQSEVDKIIK